MLLPFINLSTSSSYSFVVLTSAPRLVITAGLRGSFALKIHRLGMSLPQSIPKCHPGNHRHIAIALELSIRAPGFECI